ncbi:MAG: (d)CMP kinase [Gammaproteobacteria bacterium]
MIPVITIDGPSGVGKGSVSQLLSRELKWHFLDSGALYRILAFAAVQQNINLGDVEQLYKLAVHMPVEFKVGEVEPQIWLGSQNVTDEIRTPQSGEIASQIAALPEVRQGLLQRQQAFRQPPGLVADGRDMGTVVFPDADIKFFLQASPVERAQRRHKQLKEKGIDVNLPDLLADIEARDKRDCERSISPLRPAADAIIIDTTVLTLNQVFAKVLEIVHDKLFIKSGASK